MPACQWPDVAGGNKVKRELVPVGDNQVKHGFVHGLKGLGITGAVLIVPK